VRIPIAFTAVVAAAVASSPAQAGGLSVSPAVIDVAVKKNGEVLPPVRVTNDSDQPLEVSVELQPLGHDLSGAPRPAAADYRYAGHKLIGVKNPSFKLKPGETSALELKVEVPAGRKGGAYALLNVTGRPSDSAQAMKIGVIIELALPNEGARAFAPGKLDAAQDASNGPVTLLQRVRNAGDTHLLVGGTVSVQDARGKELGNVALEPANVFPALARNIVATWKPPPGLAAGKYTLLATLTAPGLPGQEVRGTLEFVRPGELAQSRVTVTRFPTPPVVQKKRIVLEATIANQGNVPLSPRGLVRFVNDKNGVVAEATLAAPSPIPVGQRGTIKGIVDRGLPAGTYQARLEVLNPNDNLLASFASPLQVLDRELKLAGKIARLAPPTEEEPYLSVEFANQATVDLEVSGVVVVVDDRKNAVGQVPLEPQAVKPGASAKYHRPLPELAPGAYDLQATITYGSGAEARTASQTAKYLKR
jgi:hypothetical protein